MSYLTFLRFVRHIRKNLSNFQAMQFEIAIHKSIPEQVLDKCAKWIYYTCKEAPKKILGFATNYLSETGFLHYEQTKTK